MIRNRFRRCWIERRAFDGLKVLCIQLAESMPAQNCVLSHVHADDVVVLSPRLRRVLIGGLLSRCIDAVEMATPEQLPCVLDLLRDDFVVSI